MNKKYFYWLCLIAVIFTGCKNRATPDTKTAAASSTEKTESSGGVEEETLKLTRLELTEQEWQEVKSSYNKLTNALDAIMSGDAYEGSLYIDLAGIATPEDVSLGGMMLYHTLKQQGYRFLSDQEYSERIQYVFGVDIHHPDTLDKNKFRNYKDYLVALISLPDMAEGDLTGAEFCPYRDHHYFLKNFNLCAVQMPSVLSLEMDENADKEEIRVHKNLFDYHWNNYVLNDQQGSLEWLLSNGKEKELKDLLLCFGYDKEDKINERVLNDGNIHVIDKFIGRNACGELRIHKGMLRSVRRLSEENRSDYFAAAGEFVEQIAYDPEREEQNECPRLKGIPLEERHRMIAYVVNTLQPLYEKYNGRDGYGYLDKYNIGIVDCFWKAFFDDHQLLRDIEANNCYNLPDLTQLIGKMKQDERLVNPQTGMLEPWKWSPEN